MAMDGIDCTLSVGVEIGPLTALVSINLMKGVSCSLSRTVDCVLEAANLAIVDNDPYNTYHSYSVQEMLSLYEEENLEVDDTLAILIILKIIILHERDRGNIAAETQTNKFLLELITMYNRNEHTIEDSNRQIIGTITRS